MNVTFTFQLCKKHHFGIYKPEKITQSPDDSKFLLKTLTQIKSNVSATNKRKVGIFVGFKGFYFCREALCIVFLLQ